MKFNYNEQSIFTSLDCIWFPQTYWLKWLGQNSSLRWSPLLLCLIHRHIYAHTLTHICAFNCYDSYVWVLSNLTLHVVGSDGIRAKVFVCLKENPMSGLLINLLYMHPRLSTSLIPESKLMTKLYQDKRFGDNARKILKLTCSINNVTGICEWIFPKEPYF